MWTDNTFQPIDDNAPYTVPGGTQYPGNYDKNTIDELDCVTETEYPSDNTLVVLGFHINEEYIQVWDTRPKTEDELAADAINAARTEIRRLEAQVTQRRLRDAVLGVDNGWLAAQEVLITIQRAKL